MCDAERVRELREIGRHPLAVIAIVPHALELSRRLRSADRVWDRRALVVQKVFFADLEHAQRVAAPLLPGLRRVNDHPKLLGLVRAQQPAQMPPSPRP